MLESPLARAYMLMKLTAVGASEALSTVDTGKQSRVTMLTHVYQMPTNTATAEIGNIL